MFVDSIYEDFHLSIKSLLLVDHIYDNRINDDPGDFDKSPSNKRRMTFVLNFCCFFSVSFLTFLFDFSDDSTNDLNDPTSDQSSDDRYASFNASKRNTMVKLCRNEKKTENFSLRSIVLDESRTSSTDD